MTLPFTPRIHSGPQARAQILSTPWAASWLGQARQLDRHDSDPNNRSAAWAAWAVSQLATIDGRNRTYPALLLPAKFYDPKGAFKNNQPHLEIPARVLARPNKEFPLVLSQCGNGLEFPYWTYQEVTALRRALFAETLPVSQRVLDVLDSHRQRLVAGLEHLMAWAEPHWSAVTDHIITSDDGLSDTAVGDFTQEDVARYFPPGRDLGIRVEFESKLRDLSGSWASRRVGIWHLMSGDHTTVVVTPRLTRNSLFKDPMFNPALESPAALLVRALVLKRVGTAVLDPSTVESPEMSNPPPRPHGYLRAAPALAGRRTPQASVDAALGFLHTHPSAQEGWDALSQWAERGYTLAVNEADFTAAHKRAFRLVARAEQPPREVIDVLLPLAWHDGGVVRATWATNSPTDRP